MQWQPHLLLDGLGQKSHFTQRIQGKAEMALRESDLGPGEGQEPLWL